MAGLTHREGAGLGLLARTAGELVDGFKTALGHEGPCLIEVDIEPTDAARRCASGALASRRPTGSHLDHDRCGR
jgi:hypothetical protein